MDRQTKKRLVQADCPGRPSIFGSSFSTGGYLAGRGEFFWNLRSCSGSGNHDRLWAGSCSVFPAAGIDVEKTGNSLLSDSVFSYGKFDLLSCFGRYQQVFSGSRVAGTVVSALVLPAVFLGEILP